MTLQLKVRELLQLALEINTTAPGGCVDIDTHEALDVRDATGAIIGRLDLGMGYVTWIHPTSKESTS
jgi:hypothetical protein